MKKHLTNNLPICLVMVILVILFLTIENSFAQGLVAISIIIMLVHLWTNSSRSIVAQDGESNRLLQKLNLEKERCELLILVSSEIIFDLHVASGHISWSPLYNKVFGKIPMTEIILNEKLNGYEKEQDKNLLAMKTFISKVVQNKHSDSTELLLTYASGQEHWFRVSAKCIIRDDAVKRIVGKLENIDAEIKARLEIEDLNRIDSMTGIYNKLGFKEAVEKALNTSEYGTFVFADLDNFKTVNDTLGHQIGDQVLQEMVAKLRMICRENDIIGRFGGDEFYIFAPELVQTEVAVYADNLCKKMQVTYKDITVTASLGISFYPEQGQDFDTLMHLADRASSYVKRNGKGGYHIYDAEQDN